MKDFQVMKLPSGKVLVTFSRPRPGFTIPEAVLFGTYDSEQEAEQAIAEAKTAEA